MKIVNELVDVFGRLTFILLAAWVVMAGLGMTKMPGDHTAPAPKPQRPMAAGDIWAVPVVRAPNADNALAYPAANVMG